MIWQTARWIYFSLIAKKLGETSGEENFKAYEAHRRMTGFSDLVFKLLVLHELPQ